MEYVMPAGLPDDLKLHDIVEVIDREGDAIGEQKIIHLETGFSDDKLIEVVHTDCGRCWDGKTGWWLGENDAHPYPSIRLKAK